MSRFPSGRIRCGLFAVTLLLSFSAALGQAQYDTAKWRFSNPKPFGFTTLDLDFIDDNHVIAVGDAGGIARSRDGGRTWTYGAFVFNSAAGLQTRPSFIDVHAVNSQVAYAVGSQGAMAKTTDGGSTWSFVRTPLFAKARAINTVWFTSPTTGYIGGQYNTPDSIPKVYVTRDGGSTWDSLAAPAPVQSRIGYVNNPNVGWRLVPADAKDKEILRIKFVNDSIGYISGSGLSTFLAIPNVNATIGLPTGTNTSTGGHHASLLWKFSSGRLTDYSTTKERLGYGGTIVSPVTVSSRYGQPSLQAATQSYRAMHIENDSTVLIMSFNNSIVLRVRTGRNDSTVNPGQPGRRDAGRYEVLNFPFPPIGNPIPNPQTLNASNPYEIRRAANGKLFAAGSFGLAATSTDNGNTWRMENILPQGRDFSQLGTPALDISPNGRFLTMGFQGVIADSVAGGRWRSDYVSVPLSGGYVEMEFADCNTAIAVGGSNITVTRDGGNTWINKRREDFANLFINITGLSLPEARRAYITTNSGTLYFSSDTATTLDPLYSNPDFQFNDVSTVGRDTIFVVGFSSFSVAPASRTSKIFRSTNRGASWQVLGTFPSGTTAPNLSKLAFPSNRVGYASGNRGGVFKTTDGGVTWTNISPFPATNALMNYTEVFAVDENTVFLTGNQFPRNIVYKSLDGGTTWTDVTSNLATLSSGNINGLLMHDANNGYIVRPGGVLHTTNDGGNTWNMEVAPTSCLFETIAFAPRTVPAGTPMNRRRLFVTGLNLPNGGAPMMEFGDPRLTTLNSSETVTGASCTAPTAGSVTVTATGGITPYTYSADGVNFQTSNVLTGLTRGEKTIFIREAGCGTTITKRVTIPFTDNLTLTASNDTTVCLGGTITLRAATNGTGASFSWSPAAGLASPNAAVTTAVVGAPATYTVTASLNGCTRSEPVVVQTLNVPNINAGPDATIISGDDYLMQATTTSNLKSVTWTPSTALSNPNVLTPVAAPTQTTTYRLTAVESGTDCISTDDMVITVVPNCLKVMNAFTPNGDGINDRWVVTSADVCTRNVNVTVFNRYGQMVYTNRNYTNIWDGTANGKPLPDGTYYYQVRYTLVTGREVELKGDVTILR